MILLSMASAHRTHQCTPTNIWPCIICLSSRSCHLCRHNSSRCSSLQNHASCQYGSNVNAQCPDMLQMRVQS